MQHPLLSLLTQFRAVVFFKVSVSAAVCHRSARQSFWAPFDSRFVEATLVKSSRSRLNPAASDERKETAHFSPGLDKNHSLLPRDKKQLRFLFCFNPDK